MWCTVCMEYLTLRPFTHLTLPGCCRTLILCEEIGLWGTAHSDGIVELRLLPTGAPDERYMLQLEPGKPVPSLNIPQFRAPFCVCPLGCFSLTNCMLLSTHVSSQCELALLKRVLGRCLLVPAFQRAACTCLCRTSLQGNQLLKLMGCAARPQQQHSFLHGLDAVIGVEILRQHLCAGTQRRPCASRRQRGYYGDSQQIWRSHLVA